MAKKEFENADLEKMDDFLRQKMMEEADRYEQELNADPALDGLEPSPQVFENIMAMIEKEEAAAGDDRNPNPVETASAADSSRAEDFLSEEDRRALELGRKQMAHPVRCRVMRYLGVAAAVVLGIFGVSMTSEANREKLVNVINILVAKESVARLDNEENRPHYSEEENIDKAEIEEKLGIVPITFMYVPDGMVYDGYRLDEVSGQAVMFYQYKDTIVYLTMEKREAGMSDGATRDGEIIQTFNVETDIGKVKVTEIQGPNELDYVAELNYNNCYYSIYGILPQEEFVKMIEKIEIY